MEPVKIGELPTPVVLKSRGPEVTEACVDEFERRLGYKLPADYRVFLLRYNGGDPVVGDVRGRDDNPDIPYRHGESIRSFLMLPCGTGTVGEYQELKVPREFPCQIPDDLLPIADDCCGNFFALKLGHESSLVLFLDHESDMEEEEPRVMADSFLDLLQRIVSVEEHEVKERAERQKDRQRIEHGEFPPRLADQLQRVSEAHHKVSAWCRAISLKLFDQKGHFSIHDDPLSRSVLDLMFWINQTARGRIVPTPRTELATIVRIWWAHDDEAFGLKGYAPDFVTDWWKDRLSTGALEGDYSAANFTGRASEDLLKTLQALSD